MFTVKMSEKEYKAFAALLELGVDALSHRMNEAVAELRFKQEPSEQESYDAEANEE